MLSSVSYVCLGVYAGMWVISRGWAALALKRAAPKVCVFSCWEELRFRGELRLCQNGRFRMRSSGVAQEIVVMRE